MQRLFLLILVVLATPAATVGQTAPSESQTLQALLAEVRGLRHDLQVSLTRVESAQILLSRLQIRQVAVTRASQHVDETRSKLAEVQLVQKTEAAKVASLTSLRDEVSANPEQRGDVQERLNRGQSDLAATTDLAQQRQATESEAEQQLQTEQDKLKKLEAQLANSSKTCSLSASNPIAFRVDLRRFDGCSLPATYRVPKSPGGVGLLSGAYLLPRQRTLRPLR